MRKARAFGLIATINLVMLGTLPITLQLWWEKQQLDSIGAQTIHDPSLYEELEGKIAHCGFAEIPTLYVYGEKDGSMNAYYVVNSTFPFRFRKGKVAISRSLLEFSDRGDFISIVAHELSHRDREITSFLNWSAPRRLEEEIRADHSAAQCVGSTAFIKALKDTIATKKTPLDTHEIELRIEILEKSDQEK